MLSKALRSKIENEISEFRYSRLRDILSVHGHYAIKFVQSKWATHYETPNPLKVSETPALTWGTATYVTPIIYPLSSALYGRIGLVTDFDPTEWRVFDATTNSGQRAYISWVGAQPIFEELLLTVHSTQANHLLRDQFREQFDIDCVLFHPDQEADAHTNAAHHIWMAVTDWTPARTIERGFSQCLSHARFTVLIDEDFLLQDQGLPIRVSARQIEETTQRLHNSVRNRPFSVRQVRSDPSFPQEVINCYRRGGYLHVYIEP